MSRIIVALKGISLNEALSLAKTLKGNVWGFKLNDLIIKHGVSIISLFREYSNVMADVKTFEIPDDMVNEIDVVLTYGAGIITVHCSADFNPKKEDKDYIAGVTVLTTFDEEKCTKIYNRSINEQIHQFVDTVAIPYQYPYVVCSAKDLRDISLKDKLLKNSIMPICPAIRPTWVDVKKDDQYRTMTPSEAILAGAYYLVVGRPIVQSNNPLDVVKKINEEVNYVL